MAQGIRLLGVTKRYGGVAALADVSLEVAPGEFLTLLGPSGSGKSTLLRIVAGLLEPTSGSVEIGGRDVTRLPPRERNIGMVFQHYALFPHLSVFENVAFGLREKRTPAAPLRARVEELLAVVGLTGLEDRFPKQLSGGQQQRVALARALSTRPAILLMDEPLGALDLKLRQQMQAELKSIQRRLGVTVLFVTHDQGEAFNLSDRICVVDAGHAVQVGTAKDIYCQPRSRFVASFVGDINVMPGVVTEVDGETVRLRLWGRVPAAAHLPPWLRATEGTRLWAGVRPENVSPRGTGGVPATTVRLRVTERKFLGPTTWIRGDVVDGEGSFTLVGRYADREAGADQVLEVSWSVDDLVLMPGD